MPRGSRTPAAQAGKPPRRAASSEEVPAKVEASPAGRKPTRQRTNTAIGDEIGAAELARRVAESLKKFRHERRLSLDDLSSKSGVSRAALSQIEGARTNPTLAVLWKIAIGLGIPFHDLLGGDADQAVRVLRAGDAAPLRSADGRTESRLLSPGGASTDVELYELRLVPKAVHKSEAHAHGTTETVLVLTGSLRLGVEGATYDLGPGDSVFFRADLAHFYENLNTRETRFVNVIHYVRQ